MKQRIQQILMALLGFAGYTACSSVDMYGCPPPAPEYGCPFAEYVVNAEIKDSETDSPIEGIRVSVVNRYEGSRYVDTLATGLTSANGKALLQFSNLPQTSHEVVADDIDGEANGGDYNSASTTVATSNTDYEGGNDGWSNGTATHNVTITLTKKSE